MEFREAKPADVPVLAAMNRQLIQDEGHRNPMNDEQLAARMRGWLVSGEYEAVIFAQGGVEVGYGLYRREADHVYLRQFFVDRERRRQGIGRAALDWLRVHAWADAPRIRVDVLVNNPRGVAFWRAVGFVDTYLSLEMDLPSGEGEED